MADTPIPDEQVTDALDAEVDDVEFESTEDTEVEATEESTEDTEAVDNEETEAPAEETEEAEVADESESEEPEEEAQDAEAIKQHNAQMARQRIEERERRRSEEEYLKKAQQEFVESAENDAQAVYRKMEVREYNDSVKANEQSILTEYERVKADPSLQAFNPDSKDFNPDLYAMFEENFEKANVEVDQFGNIVGVKGSLYQEAKRWGSLLNKQSTIAQARGQKTAQRNLAKSKPLGDSNKQPAPKSDPIMESLENWDED